MTPASSKPAAPLAKGGRQTQLDTGSLAILRLICLAARQLWSQAGAIPKWTNAWLVLEAGDGSAASPFFGKVIDCGSDGAEPSQSSDFCKDWWQLRGGKDGRRQVRKAPAAGAGGSDKNRLENSSDGGTGQASRGSGDDGEDGASSDATGFPPQQILSRSDVKAMVGGVIGSKSLAEADLKKALLRGGLEDINELTYGDIEDFFNTAGSLLRAQCESKNSFSWARVCPPAMLCNKWSSPGYAHIVDSTEFLPPNHRSSKGQRLRKKRLAVYVAVHLSPFYAKVLDMHFAASRLSGRKKRFRRKDPLDDVSKPAKVRKKRAVGNGGKLKKSAVAAAGADARARLTEAKRVAAAAREKAAVARAAEPAADIAEAADAAAAAQRRRLRLLHLVQRALLAGVAARVALCVLRRGAR